MSKVYVGNLNSRVSEKTIEDQFLPYSSLQCVRITRKSPNYAFVDFDDRNDALQAIRNLDGVHGWKVKPSHTSFKGGGRAEQSPNPNLPCSNCGELSHLAPDCRFLAPIRRICVKNKSLPGDEQWRIRGEKAFGNGDQSKIIVDEVPVSQPCNQDNVERKPFELGKLSIDDLASNQKTYKKNKSNTGYEKEAVLKWQIRENKNSGVRDQSKVIVDEVPVSQQCNQDNVESKPFGPEKPSIDEVASNLKSELEEKVRELGAVNEENKNLKHKMNEADAERTSAKAMEKEMALKLKKLGEELEENKNRLTFSKVKGEDMFSMIKKLKAELAKSKYNASSAKVKESELSFKLKKVQDELEKVKSNASSAKNKEEEMSMKLKKLEEKLRNSEKYAVQLNKKLKEVEGVKETLQAEMKYISEKTEEWRKRADATATIFSVGVEINTEMSESEPIFSCYMNRATTQLSIQSVRESLLYLRMAATLDPNSREPLLMSAKCHLTLGEVEDALYYYNKCLKSIPCLDRRITIEATKGIQKAQKLISCIKQSSELLQQRTLSSATKALEVISEAMAISSSSEKLLEMQGEALFVLRKYEEVVQLCEITLYFAETNFAGVTNQVVAGKNLPKLWRWNLMSKSYYRLGRLEIALNFIEKQEKLRSIEAKIEESTSPLAATVRELLHCKNAGNEAFQSGKYTEALEHYSNALSRSTESHPFSAICLCNRAAAYLALNKIADAIADCNLALALDASYQKALLRRAKLHEKIRDYEKSARDLKRFISVVEKQPPGGQAGINEARLQLSYIEEKAKKQTTMDLYLILGVNASDSASEIKKAYRRAALSHHPDKAGQFIARSDSGNDGQLWKDISKTVSMDADELFKIIGEAYSVLSDSSKRSKYDNEEKKRDDEEEDSHNS